MLTVCWSPKGGSGTSVVAAALALQIAAAGHDCLLVDGAGDQPAILGIPPDDRPGLADWLAASDEVPADALRALAVPVHDRLRLLPQGSLRSAAVDPGRFALAGALFDADNAPVVVDAGSGPGIDRWWPAAVTTVAVVRSCYLGLWRLRTECEPTDRVVLVEEPGRALTRRDVGAALGEPAAVLPWDPAVARAVDAGLLAHRMPRSLRRLRPVMPVRPSEVVR